MFKYFKIVGIVGLILVGILIIWDLVDFVGLLMAWMESMKGHGSVAVGGLMVLEELLKLLLLMFFGPSLAILFLFVASEHGEWLC